MKKRAGNPPGFSVQAENHYGYSVRVVTAATAGPFTREWVRENLTPPKRWGDRRPNDAGCDRIVAAFNRVFVDENYLALNAGTSVCIHAGNQNTYINYERPAQRLWTRSVLGLSVIPWIELSAVTKGRVGYAPEGPVVQLLHKGIPLITGERPSAEAIARELERQRKRHRFG